MKKTTSFIAIAVVTALLGGILIGCSNSSTASSAPATAATEEEIEEAPSSSASADNPIVVKATQCFNGTHPWGLGFEYLGEILKERTNGEMVVEVYHASSISGGSTRTMIEMTGTGGVELSINSPLVYQGFNNNYSVFSLPFLFPDTETGLEAMKSELGQQALNWLEPNGIVGIGVTQNGYRQLTNAVRPVTSPEDLKGMKLRIPDSPILISIFKAMGADPTSLNMTEVYTSIQQGTVDGQENPTPVIDSNKLYEVCPYITSWTYLWDPAFIMCNKAFLDGLSDEHREIFLECVEETADYITQLINEQEESLLTKFEEEGCEVVTLTDEQTQVFKDATASVYDEYRESIGSDIVDGFISEVERISSGQ